MFVCFLESIISESLKIQPLQSSETQGKSVGHGQNGATNSLEIFIMAKLLKYSGRVTNKFCEIFVITYHCIALSCTCFVSDIFRWKLILLKLSPTECRSLVRLDTFVRSELSRKHTNYYLVRL